jgi:hypothetical protein
MIVGFMVLMVTTIIVLFMVLICALLADFFEPLLARMKHWVSGNPYPPNPAIRRAKRLARNRSSASGYDSTLDTTTLVTTQIITNINMNSNLP